MKKGFVIRFTYEEIEELLECVTPKLRSKIRSKIDTSELDTIKRLEEENSARIKAAKSFNGSENKMIDVAEEYRKNLIKNQTNSESIFKAKLKSINVSYEFQKIIFTKSNFSIVDFYLPDYGLVIEIDGGYHLTNEQKENDKFRTAKLSNIGYKNLKRFTNEEAVNIKDISLMNYLKSIKRLIKKKYKPKFKVT